MKNNLRKIFLGTLAVLSTVTQVSGYVYSSHQSVWTPPSIAIQIKLGTGAALSDGTNYSSSVQAAMETWNGQLGTVQFVPQIVAVGGQVDFVNDIYFDSTIEGEAFGSGVLAVTLTYTSPSVFEIFETDIIFNTAWMWDSYRGILRTPEDIRRVAMHELGHVLGLGHPDEHGQTVEALMNSIVSDLDGLAPDDIAGAQSLYRAPGETYGPGNDNFANAEVISLASGSGLATGSTLYATKEADEPDHGGTGTASVWWRWTAPANGNMTINTQGSKFDTLLGVYTGSVVFSLTEVASNDDVSQGTARYSSVTFAAASGTTYQIAVDGWGGASGTVTLNLGFTPAVVSVAPVIITHPVNQTVNPGQMATFSVTASGTPAPTYIWRKSGINLANAGRVSGVYGTTLTITNVQADDAANYSVVAINDAGVATSDAATLTVRTPVQFTSRPLSKLAVVGQSVSFSAVATGDGALTYQWKRNGQIIAGATGATLNIASATLADRGNYELAVTGTAGTSRTYCSLNVAIPNAAVVAWGDNQYGQLMVPAGLGGVASLAIEWHNLALRTDGTVAAWAGSPLPSALSVPEGLNNVVAVSAGNGFSLALKSDGTVVAWGDDFSGRTTIPVGLTDVVGIAAGGTFSVALKADGTVVAWGYNGNNQTDIPAGLNDVIAVSAGSEHTLALKADGTVVAWGYYGGGAITIPAGLSGVIAVAGGSSLSLALKIDGTVVGWGSSPGATTPAGLSEVTGIAAGSSHGLALKNDGTVVAWGHNGSGQTTVPVTVVNAVGIYAGNGHSVALVPAIPPTITGQPVAQLVTAGGSANFTVSASGTMPFAYQWRRNGVALMNGGRISGANSSTLVVSQTVDGDGGNYSVVVSNAGGSDTSANATLTVAPRPIIASMPTSKIGLIGQSTTFSVGATGNGLTYVWMHNGQVVAGATGSTLTIPSVIAADRGYYDVIITNAEGGTNTTRFLFKVSSSSAMVIGWGDNGSGQLNPPGTPGNVLEVATSGSHSLAVLSDGTVLGWGSNSAGQTTIPANLNNVVEVAAGANAFSLALKSDGTVVAWGSNSHGQLNVPVGLSDVISIATGDSHSLALKGDGTVVAWGLNYDSSTAVPAGLNRVMAIAAAGQHSVALKDDGTIIQWGDPDASWDVPAGLTNVIAIAAGPKFAVALKADGTVVSWGGRFFDRVHPTVPENLSGVTAIAAGSQHVMAQKDDGSLLAWGSNSVGQATIPALAAVYTFAVGGASNLALIPATGLTLSTQPTNQSVLAGASVNLVVSATGAGVLSYQWYRDGQLLENGGNIAGVNTATLSLSGVTELDEGRYYAIVTDQHENVTSATAMLEVTPTGPSPTFTQRPLSRLAMVGSTQVFTASANATSYQWKHLGRILGGVTGPTLSFNNITLEHDGYYEVLATNAGGGISRSVFYLSVAPVSTTMLTSTAPNNQGQVNVPSEALYNSAKIAVGSEHSLALRPNGTVIAWGANYSGQANVPAGLTDVVAIQGGSFHSLALKADGTVVSFGNSFSALLPSAGLSGIVAISTRGGHSLALKADGTVVAWGENGDGRATVPSGLSDVVAIAAGESHSLALKADGTVVAWGYAGTGATEVPATLGKVKNIAAGGDYSAAQLQDGSLRVWPNYSNRPHIPTDLGPVFGFGAGYYYLMVIRLDGQVVSFGPNGQIANVPNGSGVAVAIAAAYHILVLETPLALPTITTQPSNATVAAGQNASFSVVAAGDGVSFQWRKNGSNLTDVGNISGATSATLTITNAQVGNTGRYDVVVSYANGTVTSEVAWLGIPTTATAQADFNADGWSDLLLENSASGERVIWQMNGATIAGSTNLPTFTAGWHFAGTGDFSGDGRADIVLQNTQSGERVIWQMDGATITGSLGLPTLPVAWQFACVGDINNDGHPDILLQNTTTNDRIIWLMSGNSITSSVALPSLPADWQICGVLDFSGDNQPDVLIQNTTSGERVIWVLNNQLAITQSLALPTFYAGWRFAGVGHYTLDNLPNILLQNTLTGERVLWSIDPNGTIASSTGLPTLPVSWSFAGPANNRASAPTLSDLTLDGQSDILVTNTQDGMRIIWQMVGNEIAGSIALPTLPAAWEFAGIGDFNADGMNDILLQNMSTGDRIIWLMNGSAIGGSVALPTLPVSWSFAAIADVNLDGQPDIVLQNTQSGERVIWVMDCTTIHASLGLPTLPVSWQIAAGGAFTADGRASLLLENAASGDRLFWTLNPDGAIDQSVGLAVFLGGWRFAGTGDFNADGQPDIILQNLITGERVIWQMNRTAIGSSLGLPALPTDWRLRD